MSSNGQARESLIFEAKKTSLQKGACTVIITGRLREYIRFLDGKLVLYDVIGKAPDQVRLLGEEIEIIREMEEKKGNRKSRALTEKKSRSMNTNRFSLR